MTQQRNTDFDARILIYFSVIYLSKNIIYQTINAIKCFYCVLWCGRIREIWSLGICRGKKKKKNLHRKRWWHGRNAEKISHTLVFMTLLKGSWCWQKGVLWGILSIHRHPWPCTARLCALCPQSAKFLACSPLPFGQRWYVHDRKDNILRSPRRVHAATHCLASNNKSHI